MQEIEAKNINPFLHYYSIGNIDKNKLQYAELLDNNTGETRWFLIDGLNNTTPVFTNEANIITLSPNSCIFVGELNGKSNLYYAQGPVENEDMYWTIDLAYEPKSISRYDNNHAIVKCNKGCFFFNKSKLEQSSDIFDELLFGQIEDNNSVLFTKKVDYLDITDRITGIVTTEGKIGSFVYDDLDSCIKTAPKISRTSNYDLLDYEKINLNISKKYETMCKEREEMIKKLQRVNQCKNRKND